MKKVFMIVGALNVGGAENMIYELTKNIDKSLFEVSVLCYLSRTDSYIERKTEENVKLFFLNENGHIGVHSFKNVFKAINSIDPDIIHAHLGGMVYAIPWAFLHPRKALMITAHTRADKAFNKKIEWLLRVLLKFRKSKTMVVAVSDENHAAVKKHFSAGDDVCKCINNGIDIKKFYREEHDCFTFINVATQDQNKNQIAIIRAVERLKKSGINAKLILVGSGPCSESLKAEADSLGIADSVLFTGQVSDTSQCYAQSDVYVQASFQEALPLSVLEAMASGLPIISTDVGGLKDVVNQNGILIGAGDDDALFSAMNTIISASESQYEFMAAKSKDIVKSYSSIRMAEKYEQAYSELLNNPK